jgi:predicted NodU family carbamoyl transferase
MKIDVSKIKGYKDMTDEEKIKALEAYEAEDDYSGYVRKEVFDKTASELAAKKKELNERLSEDERAKQAEKEQLEKLQNDYNALLRENEVSKFKANLLSMGYDDKLAEATAIAMVDGDTATVFDNQKKHLENVKKEMKAAILKDTPKPTGDGESKTMTLDKLRKLSPVERANWSRQNPEEYKILYTEKSDTGGNE